MSASAPKLGVATALPIAQRVFGRWPPSSLERTGSATHAARSPAPLAPHADKLRSLFGWIVPPCLRFIAKECRAMLNVGITATDEITRVRALMTMFDTLVIARLADAGDMLPLWVENFFVFALVWSVGGLVDGASRVELARDGARRRAHHDEATVTARRRPSRRCFGTGTPERGWQSDLLHHVLSFGKEQRMVS